MHGSLKMLLDTLMDKQALSSWQIYEEKNGSVVVKIRFAARHCNVTVTGATAIEDKIIAYKRKSPAQIRRDNARSKQVTRSQTVRTDNDIVPQDISEPEIARTNDNDFLSETLNPGLVSPMPCAAEPTSVLDPSCLPSPQLACAWPRVTLPLPEWRMRSFQHLVSVMPRVRMSNLHPWIRYHQCPVLRNLIMTMVMWRYTQPPFGCWSRPWWS